MRGKQPLRNGYFFTRAYLIKSAKSTKAKRLWTGWFRRESGGLLLPQPPPRVFGFPSCSKDGKRRVRMLLKQKSVKNRNTGLILLILPDTLILRLRWSVLFVCLMGVW